MQVSPVSLALQDRNPYVRRTAVLGVLKIYNLDAAAVRNAGIVKDYKSSVLVSLFLSCCLQSQLAHRNAGGSAQSSANRP